MDIQAFYRRIGLSFFTGCIFYALAEAVFWGRFDFLGQFWSEFIPTLTLYCLAAYLFLWALQTFHITDWAGVFLAGVLYGWFIEGLVVQTMYDDLPLSIIITAISWHAFIVVYEGWYMPRRLIQEQRLFPLFWHALVFGAFWGLWSVWWWIEVREITPLPQYCLYAAITSLLYIGGVYGSSRIRLDVFPPPRIEGGVVRAICALYFCFITIPANIHALWLFPVCVGLVIFALTTNRQDAQPNPDLLEFHPSLAQLCCLLAFPVTAIGVYGCLLSNNMRIATGPAIYIASAIGGTLLFFQALYKALFRSRNRVEGEV